MGALPEPSVSANAYDEAYYREWCAGYQEWVASNGQAVAGIYPGFLVRAALQPGEVVVDIGTGRGELPVTAVALGAAHGYGVEYSDAAVAMACQTVSAHGVEDRVDIVLADARSVPLPDGTADLVSFVDVVEHLTPEELHAALVEARRLLKPTGRVVAHTMPNRLVYDVTYRALRPIVGRSWPKDPRTEPEREMHVNEHTVRSLRRAFRQAGLEADVTLGEWVRDDCPPDARVRRAMRVLAKARPLAHLVVCDIWAFGTLPRTG